MDTRTTERKSVLVIQGYKEAEARIRRHWLHYLKAKPWRLLLAERLGQPIDWPREGDVSWERVAIGQPGYVQTGNLSALLVECFRNAFYLFPEATDICVIENDSIFVRELPPHPGGLCSTLAGGNSPGFYSMQYFHTPWWADRATALRIVKKGELMLRLKLSEQGFPDRFLGLMVDLCDLPVTPAAAWTCNTADRPSLIASARQAIKDGCFYLHGIKTEEQLKAILAP